MAQAFFKCNREMSDLAEKIIAAFEAPDFGVVARGQPTSYQR
jgi:hypothetical protein